MDKRAGSPIEKIFSWAAENIPGISCEECEQWDVLVVGELL